MFTGGIGASSIGAGTMYYTNRLQTRKQEETGSEEFAADMANKALEMFDQDGDGLLSADEFDADIVARADSDGDGYLSLEELTADAKDMKPPPPPEAGGMNQLLGQMQMLMQSDDAETSAESLAGKLMDMLDSDGDGVISTEEMAGDDRLATADSDGDGTITLEELTAAMTAGKPAGGGPSGGAGASKANDEFDALDTNEDGVVSTEELAAAGYSTDVDQDGDGSVTFEEFKAALEENNGATPPPPPGMREAETAGQMSGQMGRNGNETVNIARLYEMLSNLAGGYDGGLSSSFLNILA